MIGRDAISEHRPFPVGPASGGRYREYTPRDVDGGGGHTGSGEMLSVHSLLSVGSETRRAGTETWRAGSWGRTYMGALAPTGMETRPYEPRR